MCEKLVDSEEHFVANSSRETPYLWLGVCLGVVVCCVKLSFLCMCIIKDVWYIQCVISIIGMSIAVQTELVKWSELHNLSVQAL